MIVQLVPIPDSVLILPGRNSAALYDLVFQATNLPALGLRSYYVTKLAQDNGRKVTVGGRADVIGNEVIKHMVNYFQTHVRLLIGREVFISILRCSVFVC